MRQRLWPGSPPAGPAARLARRALVAAGAVAAMSAGGAVPAAPNGLSPTGLSLSGQWFRLVMPSIPAAGYFILSNTTAAPQRLVGAASPACAMLMLHRSVNQNGEEQMMSVSSVLVPGHGEVRFAPGGYHLMCMAPTAAMKPANSVPVTLRFAGGETLTASFPVRGATGR